MKILESKFVQGFIKMADDGYQQGWHERNGGNLSYRLKAEEVEMIRPRLNAPGEWTPIGVEVPGLAREFFLVTGSGKYFRNIIVDPEVCLAIIELDETGTNYRIRWGLVEGGRPTSELPTHLMNHEVKKKLTNGKHRVIYHAHTTNTIALTFVLPLDDKVFTRELWESATECPVVFPDGVGVIGWMWHGTFHTNLIDQIRELPPELLCEQDHPYLFIVHGSFDGSTKCSSFMHYNTVHTCQPHSCQRIHIITDQIHLHLTIYLRS